MGTVTKPAVLLAIVLWVVPAFADKHKWVAGDALEPGTIYVLIAPGTRLQTAWQTMKLGVWLLPAGSLIKVYERKTAGGALWYRVKRIKPRTIGDHDNLPGWIGANELEDHGVFQTY